jgi:CcmD family protein
MPNLVYLLSAYAVFWALTFVLVFSIWARQRRLEREIAALAARLEEDGRDADAGAAHAAA